MDASSVAFWVAVGIGAALAVTLLVLSVLLLRRIIGLGKALSESGRVMREAAERMQEEARRAGNGMKRISEREPTDPESAGMPAAEPPEGREGSE